MSTDQVGGEQPSPLDLTRLQLYVKVWGSSMPKVAQELGCPPRWLEGVCRAAQIPLPTHDYWVRKRSGKAAHRRPLPKGLDPNERVTAYCGDSAIERVAPMFPPAQPPLVLDPDVAGILRVVEQMPAFEVPEPGSRRRRHAAVAATTRMLRRTARNEWKARFNRIRHRERLPEAVFLVEVGKDSIDRAMQLLQALIDAVVGLGGTIISDGGDRLGFKLLEEEHTVRLREHLVRHFAEGAGEGEQKDCVWRPTGELELHLESWPDGQRLEKWSDGVRGTLEGQMRAILFGLLKQVQRTREVRTKIRREEEEKKRERDERHRVAAEAKRAEHRPKVLLEVAQLFDAHTMVRRMLDACRRESPRDPFVEHWLHLAESAAHSLDPFADGVAGLRDRVEKRIDDKMADWSSSDYRSSILPFSR